ncbi:MAG: hypothetical protein LLF96_02645, partial [Eubacteriales bacterium]|nr:hypothetical protein [Eubacteriales bacterium]
GADLSTEGSPEDRDSNGSADGYPGGGVTGVLGHFSPAFFGHFIPALTTGMNEMKSAWIPAQGIIPESF